jgi:hypothetical protein
MGRARDGERAAIRGRQDSAVCHVSCTAARSLERKGEARGRGLRGYLCGEDEAADCGR